jgi:hypothetical protein
MSRPSRDRHTVRLAQRRKRRWLSVVGVVLGLAGLSLALWAEERPLRVVGILVLAVSLFVVQPLLWALSRPLPWDRYDF